MKKELKTKITATIEVNFLVDVNQRWSQECQIAQVKRQAAEYAEKVIRKGLDPFFPARALTIKTKQICITEEPEDNGEMQS